MKILWHFEFFVNKTIWGWKLKKLYSYRFPPISAKLYEDIGYHWHPRLLPFSVIG